MSMNPDLVKKRLEEIVANGAREGARVIESVLGTVPTDEIQPAKTTALLVTGRSAPTYSTQIGQTPLSEYALGQLLDRVGGAKFSAYAKEQLSLRAEVRDDRGRLKQERESWRGDLVEQLAARHLAESKDRYLIRRVGDQVRGVLSDRFKRIDCRPMVDAFIGAAQKLGAVPSGGHATETRVSIRCIIPKVYEVTPGEHVVFGMHFGNSDFGAGSFSLGAFLLRLLCLNGMTGETEYRKTHVGSRLADDVEYSRKTYDLDQRALISATQDVTAKLLLPANLDKRSAGIAKLSARGELPFSEVVKSIGKTLSKTERAAIEDSYEGPDTLNLPKGQTLWRFTNAVSWLANDKEKIKSEDRRLELQQMAGKIVEAA